MEKNKTVSVVELSPKQSRESSQYPVSPQVENIKEEKERVSNNWITKEYGWRGSSPFSQCCSCRERKKSSDN